MTPSLQVPEDAKGIRFDIWISQTHTQHSRAAWQKLIKTGAVQLNHQTVKPNHTLNGGEVVTFDLPAPQPVDLVPQAIPLHILFEDEHLLALNKPAGLVVHPAPGHDSGTLVNALLHHCHDLQGIGGELRPGIVHRLDKDTSGVLVIAKNEPALNHLATQFKNRQTTKKYIALVHGLPQPPSQTIDTLIARHPTQRKKMAVHPQSGRRAITHFTTEHTFTEAARLAVTIETGRTHQIRVHLRHIGHPILGDQRYGHKASLHHPTSASRQMLHASQLTLTHPVTDESLTFTAPLPKDILVVQHALEHSKS